MHPPSQGGAGCPVSVCTVHTIPKVSYDSIKVQEYTHGHAVRALQGSGGSPVLPGGALGTPYAMHPPSQGGAGCPVSVCTVHTIPKVSCDSTKVHEHTHVRTVWAPQVSRW